MTDKHLQPRVSVYRCLAFGWVVLLLAGCAAREATVSTPTIATPTVSPLFLAPDTPTAESTRIPVPTQIAATPAPTIDPALSPTPVALGEDIAQVSIYDDMLGGDWSLSDSSGMRYTPGNADFVYAGSKSIAATPQQPFGSLLFSVKPGAKSVYRRDNVLGVSFWLNAGEHTIAPQDLAVSVLGSNALTYWKAGDTSVKAAASTSPSTSIFPETRLYYLDINQNIPPNTWVQVILWLADRADAPDYTYVTGIAIKNDELFTDSFYVDEVQLLLAK